MNKKTLIFTDLDGTLLDHYTYQTDSADKTIAQLKEKNIPIIPNTSKTLDEVLLIREDLKLDSPFIIENGAAVYIPVNYFSEQPLGSRLENGFWVKSFCQKRDFWLSLLNLNAPQFSAHFRGFSQMSAQQLADLTGLSLTDAGLAKRRQYGEPLEWLGDQQSQANFIKQMKLSGANVLAGGRFLHISGNCDKGQAQSWLAQQYKINQAEQVFTTIALGDSHNDTAMLEAADVAVLVRSPAHDFPTLQRVTDVYFSREYGPAGWAECLQKIIF
ncbi:MAG: mannosyl-3-phosphoglycerate phosphatase [Psychromonas sp.]|jgi:mannosyl-3-phosphoglycerate phosphatase|uniref:HAD-IIB family hydrolase n=1 Tax=Psychromonas sp. TaxID=1884585 RepID=UPI0039E6D010